MDLGSQCAGHFQCEVYYACQSIESDNRSRVIISRVTENTV